MTIIIFHAAGKKKLCKSLEGTESSFRISFLLSLRCLAEAAGRKKLNLLNLLHSYKPLKAFGLFQKSAKRPLLFSILHHNRLLIGLFLGEI